ncbi:MAG: Dephospho-CoA kinase [Paracidovorax wautersii]|uniref:Dephospho-CoA kinase n=1 Tax=Paracidovorax wautersii TaxID=1177982 RepID=A0A7V8FQB1_9BURK|nr:MAG: Dephospho-CoA kinase [Paracidovorax wautersii]
MNTAPVQSNTASAPGEAPLRLGLTGGIGSGKSTVAAILTAAGAVVIDADAISRAVTAPGGAAIEPLRQALGAQAIDASGGLDRQAMRQRLIDDPQAKATLEAIVHPLVRQAIERQTQAAAGAPCIVYDIPLLAESAATWRERLDKILVVDCAVDTQVRRVMARSGWPEETVRAIIARQATREQRRAIADAVIDNDGIGLDELRQRVLATVLQWAPTLAV